MVPYFRRNLTGEWENLHGDRMSAITINSARHVRNYPIQKHLLKSVQTRVHGGCTPMNCDVSIQRFNRGSPGRQVGNPDGTASMVYYRNIICWKDDLHWALWHGRVRRVRRVLEWSALGEGTWSHVATLSHILVSLTWNKPTKNQLCKTTKSTQSTECL